MAEMTLTQATADALIAMEKHRADEETYRYPLPGGGISIPLIGTDEHEEFVLDMRRSRVDVRKASYNNRVRVTIVLVRLCLGVGQRHTNPDGAVVCGAHLHRYREGSGDKWAAPTLPDAFTDTTDLWVALQDFMRYCNITRLPVIQQSLFR